jgi:hypothetical protein
MNRYLKDWRWVLGGLLCVVAWLIVMLQPFHDQRVELRGWFVAAAVLVAAATIILRPGYRWAVLPWWLIVIFAALLPEMAARFPDALMVLLIVGCGGVIYWSFRWTTRWIWKKDQEKDHLQ